MFNPSINENLPFAEVTGKEKMSPAGTPYYDPSVKRPADYHSLLPDTQSLM